MEVLHPRCAGLDVHKDSVVACVRCVSQPAHREVPTFETTTKDLFALADWLESHGCTHVAMEATGVYWKPVWHLLEGRLEGEDAAHEPDPRPLEATGAQGAWQVRHDLT